VLFCHYKKDKYGEQRRNGVCIKYYKNGSKKEERIYHEGMKNGIWKYWRENGKIKIEEYYKHRYYRAFDYV